MRSTGTPTGLDDGGGLGLPDSDAGPAGAIYVSGACSGALFFGWPTDRLGRKKLFMIIPALYLAAMPAAELSSR